jgi:antitoxin component YwqK of YwqJK toxin-antitoxin module
MKKRILLLTLFVVAAICSVSAQKEYDIEHITVINLGDGRYLFRTHEKDDKDEKPLQGEHKIIDGYHSEYILADFKDGLYNGKYKHFKNNKLKEEGTYKEGNKDGVYTIYKGDGTIEKQETFKAGKSDDMKKEYYSDGTLKSESLYKDGKKEGLWKTYYTDGKLQLEKSYKDGLDDGPERKYDFETGDLTAELNFVKGKKDGKQRQRMVSNQRNFFINSNYTNGVLDGEYDETYEDNGVVAKKGVYKNGKEEGIWKYNFHDGVQQKELSYKNGKEDGECKYYFDDGTLKKIENYKDGKLDGVSRSYYSGNKKQVKIDANYTNGKKNGRYVNYESDGTISIESVYDNEKLMSSKHYINGKLWRTQEFVNGTMVMTEYDDKGNKKER